ncbi:MAG: rod shape-determining protein MreC [Acidobacteria bacterium RIFCSPLOWO2_02_FULL_65_29]|nr:MAG: rod shape-determining protein MreC [Acidobacteria bacterium RIFCSPLOWO2_02_FULL_65_29]
MAILDLRQRAGYLFLAVLLGLVILISAQVNSKSGVPVLEAAVFGVFAEVQRGTSAVVSGISRAWSGYVGLRQVHADNERLRQRLAETQLALQEQRALADRSHGLERLLELRHRTSLRTTGAEIIAAGATPDFRTVTIDKGARQGLMTDMAVMAPAGVVGRVIVPSGNAAKVQLLIDRNAAAGAVIERRESRAQGVVVGTGNGRLRMEYVSEIADIVVGDVVVTSGIDGIYPKGFVIGRVEVVEKIGPAYKQILVRPAVDFSSLEEVLVVLTPPEGREAAREPTP